MATPPYPTSPLTPTNGQARPLWLHPCDFRQSISSEYPTSLPSFCITNSYSSFASTVDLFLLQDRFSDSPRLGGTSLCFPTSLYFYPLWPPELYICFSILHMAWKFLRLCSSTNMVCWKDGDGLDEWMNEWFGC